MVDPDRRAVHDLLGRALTDEPPQLLNADHLATVGRQRLHRRRMMTTAGLAVTAVAAAGLVWTGYHRNAAPVADRPTAAASTASGASCGPEAGARPSAPSRSAPRQEVVSDLVKGALGTIDSGTPAQPADPANSKFSFQVADSEQLAVQMLPAGEQAAEVAWAVAEARHQCGTPATTALPDGGSLVTAQTPAGELVIAIADGWHVYLALSYGDATSRHVSTAQLTTLAGGLVKLP